MVTIKEVQNSNDQYQNYLNQLQQVSTPLPSSFPSSITNLIGKDTQSTSMSDLTKQMSQTDSNSGSNDLGYMFLSVVLFILPLVAVIVKAKYKST